MLLPHWSERPEENGPQTGQGAGHTSKCCHLRHRGPTELGEYL